MPCHTRRICVASHLKENHITIETFVSSKGPSRSAFSPVGKGRKERKKAFPAKPITPKVLDVQSLTSPPWLAGWPQQRLTQPLC
jgi:hypothetical protein